MKKEAGEEEKIICLKCEYDRAEQSLINLNIQLSGAKNAEEFSNLLDKAKQVIRVMVQLVEMLSWENKHYTAEELKKRGEAREPNCDDLLTHYVVPSKLGIGQLAGADLFPLKWPFIWDEIQSPLNRYYAAQTFGADPDIFEMYHQYVFHGGLESFWKRHYIKEGAVSPADIPTAPAEEPEQRRAA